MDLQRSADALIVQTGVYTITCPVTRPFIILQDREGRTWADIFVYSSVNSLSALDDTPDFHAPDALEQDGSVLLRWQTASNAWRLKTYSLRCLPQGLEYFITVEGEGDLTDVQYFGGNWSGSQRWGSGFFWSGRRFSQAFCPEPDRDRPHFFDPSQPVGIDLAGVPLPGRANWFFTPAPFFYAFRAEGEPERWLGMGVQARPGEHRFTQFSYHPRPDSFHLTLSYEGHTRVRGAYDLPVIGFDFAQDAFKALSSHTQAIEPSPVSHNGSSSYPSWWSEPIFCGWGAQCHIALHESRLAQNYSRQSLYDQFLSELESRGVEPGIVVLDDKWQATYGENCADREKWPDLEGFIERQHDRGRHVLLWLKAWDPEGLPAEETIRNAGGLPVAADPTHPGYRRRLRRQVERMLSPTGYHADGFKVDFTARIPTGPGMQVYGDAWGLELMREYLYLLYSLVKEVRPDALVMTHTPHPYLADCLDMIRLNDIIKERDVNTEMRIRARIASIACPDALIDTDNWPMPDRLSWRNYLQFQRELGVPSLYFVTHIDETREPLEDVDFLQLQETWSLRRESHRRDEGV